MAVIRSSFTFAKKLLREPPLRLFSQKAVKYFSKSVRRKADWDAVERPHYLVGLLRAADEAVHEGVSEIWAIEFGVAAGGGLLALQEYAEAVERETGVRIRVCGFDTGQGLPETSGDFRDHPDHWRAADYPMDETALRARLTSRTELVIGNVSETVPRFVERSETPIGFVAFDLDLYSSTRDAFAIFARKDRRLLRRTVCYFDDVHFFLYHEFAGEMLAIKEFNAQNFGVKIDRWHGNYAERVFFERKWLAKMYVAHDIEQIANTHLDRAPRNSVSE